MATKKELRAAWYGYRSNENFVFLFDVDGDPVAWCSKCMISDTWYLSYFKGKVSYMTKTKESFKERHANCKPHQAEAKQEVKQGDDEMSKCLRSKIKRYWVRDSDDDRAKHIKFTCSETDRLNGDCDRCMTTTRVYGLANGQPINKELFDEIFAIKHQFIAKHWDCAMKAVAEQESSEPPQKTPEQIKAESRAVLQRRWLEPVKGFEHVKFILDNEGDPKYLCDYCGNRDGWYWYMFEGPDARYDLDENKKRLANECSNCKPKPTEKPQELKPEHATIQAFERRIHELATRVADTVIRKHKDYGRSGLQAPVLAPHITALDALLVRQSDKYSRLQNLLKKGTPEVKESILDTALDILGYDMLMAVEVERLSS